MTIDTLAMGMKIDVAQVVRTLSHLDDDDLETVRISVNAVAENRLRERIYKGTSPLPLSSEDKGDGDIFEEQV